MIGSDRHCSKAQRRPAGRHVTEAADRAAVSRSNWTQHTASEAFDRSDGGKGGGGGHGGVRSTPRVRRGRMVVGGTAGCSGRGGVQRLWWHCSVLAAAVALAHLRLMVTFCGGCWVAVVAIGAGAKRVPGSGRAAARQLHGSPARC